MLKLEIRLVPLYLILILKKFKVSSSTYSVLYKVVVQVDERVTLSSQDGDALDGTTKRIVGTTGETVLLLKPLDESVVRAQLKRVYTDGIKSIAISLMHAFTYPDHEEAIARIAAEIGFTNISVSSRLSPVVKYVPRTATTLLNAYLNPVLAQYLERFYAGFDNGIHGKVEFMQSDGGLVSAESFHAFKSILSGPAGGYVGFAKTSYDSNTRVPIIGFDMVFLFNR